jgi:adhesin transport system membrane fusion protein
MIKKLTDLKSKHKSQAEDQAYLTDVNVANLYGASIQSHIILWLLLVLL